MKDYCYIVVGVDGIHKLCKTENFKLDPDERAFSLTIEIPDEAFKAPPIPTIKLSIPTDALTREILINVAEQEETGG